MDNEELHKLARKRLKAKSDFRYFLLIWLGVSILLITIWFVSGMAGGYFWPGWAIGGMGVAAFFIGLEAYGPGRGIITEDAVEAEIRKMTRGGPAA